MLDPDVGLADAVQLRAHLRGRQLGERHFAVSVQERGAAPRHFTSVECDPPGATSAFLAGRVAIGIGDDLAALRIDPSLVPASLLLGEVLQTLLVALLVGFALQRMGASGAPVLTVVGHVQRLVFRLLGMIMWAASTRGPAAPPGRYQVRVTAAGETKTQDVEIRRNTAVPGVTDADLQAQFDLAMRISERVSEANRAVIRIRDIKEQITDRIGKASDGAIKTAGQALIEKLTEVEGEIYQHRLRSGQDPLNYPIRLNNKLAALQGDIQRSVADQISAFSASGEPGDRPGIRCARTLRWKRLRVLAPGGGQLLLDRDKLPAGQSSDVPPGHKRR